MDSLRHFIPTSVLSKHKQFSTNIMYIRMNRKKNRQGFNKKFPRQTKQILINSWPRRQSNNIKYPVGVVSLPSRCAQFLINIVPLRKPSKPDVRKIYATPQIYKLTLVRPSNRSPFHVNLRSQPFCLLTGKKRESEIPKEGNVTFEIPYWIL